MELITLTPENIAKEHICCAISSNNDCQVASKKAWLAERFADGLVFTKAAVRGKCFIEYIPDEKAWAPVEAEGYMYIDCLWVSGQFKGQGYSNLLLESCIADSIAKGRKGLVTVSSDKKRPFLSDPGYLKHKGFIEADRLEPYFTLMYLPFGESTPAPKFMHNKAVQTDGYTIYYTDQCPFNAKYVPLLAAEAERLGVKLETVHITSAEQARACPSPFTAFGLWHNGSFVTHEMQSVNSFAKLVTSGK